MLTMGRPRQRYKDLPRGLYKDGAGRFYLKAFDVEGRRRLGDKSSMALGRDATAARVKWAELFGFRDHDAADAGTFGEIVDRYLAEELPRKIQVKDETTGKPVVKPKYSSRTVREYKRQIKKTIRPRWGAKRYARSEADAVRGDFLRTMHFQAHVTACEEAGIGPQGNRDVSVASAIFAFGKRVGLVEYNPVLGVERHRETPRGQVPDDQLWLDLYAEASTPLQIFMDLNHMVGSRISDLLRTLDADWDSRVGLKAIPGKVKRGQRRIKQLFRATPDLAETIERARAWRRAEMSRIAREKGIPALSSIYLLPNPRTGHPYSLSGLETMVDRARVRLGRKRLGITGITPQSEAEVREWVRDLNHHFHDGRAKAGDEAKKRGEDVADFLGHTTDATSRRVYLNRSRTEITPNSKVRRA